MAKQISAQLSDETDAQLAQLALWWGEPSQRFTSNVIARCVDRVFIAEAAKRGAVDVLTDNEQDELQAVILASAGPGAEAFGMAGGYEVHPRGDDFAKPVQDWLMEHGFVRYVDTERGPADGKMAYVVTIHRQRAYLQDGDWVITEPDGEHHYPCKPDIFAERYEPTDGPTMTLSEIVQQLRSCQYECEAGPLDNNAAFIALAEMANEPVFHPTATPALDLDASRIS